LDSNRVEYKDEDLNVVFDAMVDEIVDGIPMIELRDELEPICSNIPDKDRFVLTIVAADPYK